MCSHREELHAVPTLLVESARGLPSSALVSREAFLEEMAPVLCMKVLGKMGKSQCHRGLSSWALWTWEIMEAGSESSQVAFRGGMG